MSHTQGTQIVKKKCLSKKDRIELAYQEWQALTDRERAEWNRLKSIQRHRMRAEDYNWMELFK